MLTVLGMMILTISFIGFWTAVLDNCCLLSFYFIMVLVLLMIKFSLCFAIILYPQCLGLNLNVTEMVKALQGSYGVPGLEQYTVAMDFTQTFFDCCAINDSINYDTSLWRLQKFGKKELTVPLTCCALANKFESNSYLDPIAINETLCQSIEPHEFLKSRHSEGCLDKVEYWYREQYIILLCASLILVFVEFFVLLTIVLNCTRLKKSRLSHRITPMKFTNEEQSSSGTADTFKRNMCGDKIYQDDFISVTPIREIFVQPKDLHKHKYPPTQFTGNNYRLSSNGFLI